MLRSVASRLLQRGFNTTSQLVDRHGLTKFLQGEIPESLKCDRPFKYTKLPNGMTIATEIMPGKISTVSVFIKCGSRNETLQSSGTAHFLEHLHFKGTGRRTRENLELEVERIGGNLNAYTSRENTCYMMTVFNRDLSRAVDILGDMLTNSLYRSADVENERSTIYRELIETQKSGPMETTIEIAHRGAYGSHQMGLPILGHIHNMRTISRDMIVEYHDKNYVGENIIVVGCGPIDHDQLVDDVQKYLKVGKSKAAPNSAVNFAKPAFQYGVTALESDLTENINVAAIVEAPSYFDTRFFSYLLLQRIIGDKPQTELEKIAMKRNQRYKIDLPSYRFQNLLTKYEESIEKQKGFFSSYWDTGMYGNYFMCRPDKLADVLAVTREGYQSTILINSVYAEKITDEELEKAKRRVFVEILQHENQNDISQAIGNNLMYYDRRVCRSELAERVSSVSKEDLQKVVREVMVDGKVQVTIWGNVDAVRLNGRKIELA